MARRVSAESAGKRVSAQRSARDPNGTVRAALITGGATVLAALIAGFLAFLLGQNVDASPSSPIVVASPVANVSTSRCVRFEGSGDTTTGWVIWSATRTADSGSSELTLVRVSPTTSGEWATQLNLGSPPLDSAQTVEVDFFYLDAHDSQLVELVSSQPAGSWVTLSALPSGARNLVAKRIEIVAGADSSICS